MAAVEARRGAVHVEDAHRPVEVDQRRGEDGGRAPGGIGDAGDIGQQRDPLLQNLVDDRARHRERGRCSRAVEGEDVPLFLPAVGEDQGGALPRHRRQGEREQPARQFLRRADGLQGRGDVQKRPEVAGDAAAAVGGGALGQPLRGLRVKGLTGREVEGGLDGGGSLAESRGRRHPLLPPGAGVEDEQRAAEGHEVAILQKPLPHRHAVDERPPPALQVEQPEAAGRRFEPAVAPGDGEVGDLETVRGLAADGQRLTVQGDGLAGQGAAQGEEDGAQDLDSHGFG